MAVLMCLVEIMADFLTEWSRFRGGGVISTELNERGARRRLATCFACFFSNPLAAGVGGLARQEISHTLARVPFLLPLAAGALANWLKLKSLRLLGFFGYTVHL
jgi:hypothetical protein